MKYKDPKPINHLLEDHGDHELRKIVRQVDRLIKMNKLLVANLPENLSTHCQIGQYTLTEIIILVDSAAWLMPLRYLKSELLKKLKTEPAFTHLQDIQFRIQPLQKSVSQTDAPPREIRKLSQQTRELLTSTAAEITNPLLKRSLLRLAENIN